MFSFFLLQFFDVSLKKSTYNYCFFLDQCKSIKYKGFYSPVKGNSIIWYKLRHDLKNESKQFVSLFFPELNRYYKYAVMPYGFYYLIGYYTIERKKF